MEIAKEAIKKTKSNEKEKSSIDFVKWFSEINKDSGLVAGGKGANLSEIYNLKIPVPPGFVVTAQAYDYFIEKSGIKNEIKKILSGINYEDTKQLDESTAKIRGLIVKSNFPKEMEEEILESYEALDVRDIGPKGSAHDILKNASEPIFVAVRSSATTEDLAEASFAGQQDSYVNVKGNQQLLSHIRKCFASLFTSRATYYRNKQGFKDVKASLAVVVQKMVDSDKSGVAFSIDPSQRNDNIVMEAVFGLGEGIVSGSITPDKYIVSREDMKIIETKISNKKTAITRNSSGGKEIVKLRDEKANSQVLENIEIKKLAEIALTLEEHFKKPQDIEFAIENEEIFIVQTRPITTVEKRFSESKEVSGEVVLEGIAASPGIASGKIKIINDLKDLDKIVKGDVLVTKMTNPDMVVSMQKCSAIVTDEGGMTAHAAIVSREMGIPAVVGTDTATMKLKEGEVITVDGYTGKIYKGKTTEDKQKEVLPVEDHTKTKLKVIVDLPSFAERASKSGIKKVGLTRIEGIIAESGKHPNYFLEQNKIKDYEDVVFKGVEKIAEYFDEMWVRTSDIRSDEFSNLEGAPKEKEANPMLGMHGIRFGISNPEILKAELNALKRVAEKNKKIGILMPQVISVEEVKQVKEILREINFTDAKVGVMVETPAAVQLIRELCAEGIDFISFGTNDLTQYMLAIDRGNEAVQHLYNEMHPAVLYQLEFVIRVCKRNKVETSICGQAGSRKEMVEFLVKCGIDSISVNADMAHEIAKHIAEVEMEMVKGTDKEPRNYQQENKVEEVKEESEEKDSEEKNIVEKVVEKTKDLIEDKKGEVMVADANEDAKEDDEEKNNEDKNPSEGQHNDKKENENSESEIKNDIEAIDNAEEEFSKGVEEGIKDNSGEEIKENSESEINENIEAIEEEKKEYLNEHPEESEKVNEEEKQEFTEDDFPEKHGEESDKKKGDEVLDIF